jgi:hypothetical protein
MGAIAYAFRLTETIAQVNWNCDILELGHSLRAAIAR